MGDGGKWMNKSERALDVWRNVKSKGLDAGMSKTLVLLEHGWGGGR